LKVKHHSDLIGQRSEFQLVIQSLALGFKGLTLLSYFQFSFTERSECRSLSPKWEYHHTYFTYLNQLDHEVSFLVLKLFVTTVLRHS